MSSASPRHLLAATRGSLGGLLLAALGAATGAVTVAAIPAACAHNARPAAAAEPVAPTTVRVQNQGFADMVIYVLRGGVRSRLGMVTGNSTAVLTIPSSFVQPLVQLRFIASPIAGNRTPVSEEITVSPGDEIGLAIPPG